MPNHLRPSISYRGLLKGQFETPKTFTDRIYLTDVVETLWGVVEDAGLDAKIQILKRKGYFPWKIRIILFNGNIILSSRLYGDTTWSSAVSMQFNNFDDNHNDQIKIVLERFVEGLGRLPYESPYWTEDIWKEFSRVHNMKMYRVESAWAKYCGKLNLD
jgi:hypothetical protein